MKLQMPFLFFKMGTKDLIKKERTREGSYQGFIAKN